MMDGLCWGDFNFSIYDEWFEKKSADIDIDAADCAMKDFRVVYRAWAPTARDAKFLRSCNIKPE